MGDRTKTSVECPGFVGGLVRKKKCRLCGRSLLEHGQKLPAISDAEEESSSVVRDEKKDEKRKQEKREKEERKKKDKKEKKEKKDSRKLSNGDEMRFGGSISRKGPKGLDIDLKSMEKEDRDKKGARYGSVSKRSELENPSTPRSPRLKRSPSDGEKKHKRNPSVSKRRPSESENPKSEANSAEKDDFDNLERNRRKNKAEDDSPRGRAQTMESREQVGDYILIEKIGKGAFGVVYKALHLFAGNTVAVKQLNLKGASKDVVQQLQDEIDLLRSLSHENIVRYIGHIAKGKSGLFIVMEYVENGSLASMVKKYGRFPESLTKTYTKQVLAGLIYLHEQGVIHRDIKPDNILIKTGGEVKLADFGVSTKLNALKSNSEDETVPAGTPYYMAPEVIEFFGAKPESDVWSLGCTIIELLRGEPPYYSHDPFSAMYKMVEDEHPPIPHGISLGLNDFLMSCFKKDVNMRTPARKLILHSWFRGDTESPLQPTEIIDVISEIKGHQEKIKREMGEISDSEEQEREKLLSISATLREDMRKKLLEDRKGRKEKPKLAKQPSKAMVLGFEDVEDLDWENDIDFDDAPLKLPSAQTLGFGSLEGLDLQLEDLPEAPKHTGKASLAAWADKEEDDDWVEWGDKEELLSALETNQPRVISDFVEQGGDDDFDFDFEDTPLKLVDPGEQTSWDEVLDIEEEEEQDEKAILREKAQEALGVEIKELISVLKPNQAEEKVKRSCLKLMDIFNKNPEMRTFLIANHGLLPLINMLNSDVPSILNSILRLITQIIETPEILVNLCVLGIIPAMMECGDNTHALLTRLYAAYFVQKVISTPETLQMFVACRGLSLLAEFLEHDYQKNRELVQIGIDCISSIFKLQGQTTTPKNEYFHLFAGVGLLERLSITMLNLVRDEDYRSRGEPDDDDEFSYAEKAAAILQVFSMGDSDVKSRICSKDNLTHIRDAMKLMPPHSSELLSILNMIRNLSFDRYALNQLALLIVPLLDTATFFINRGEFLKEVFNQVTHSLFHMCRLNRQRQEAAAKAGLIPFLKFVIANNKPLKEFAVPMMCELAGSSQVTRTILLENDGLQFYLDTLTDSKGTFTPDALTALAVCLEHERTRVEEIMLGPSTLEIIKNVLVNAMDHQLVTLLESILKMVTISTKVNRYWGEVTKDGSFVSVLKNKLHHPDSHVRVNLLKTINALCAKSAQPREFLKQNGLVKVVNFMATNDSSMLVQNMAKLLQT